MISPAIMVGTLGCVLLTGRDARLASIPIPLRHVQQIVICGTGDSAVVLALTKGRNYAVQCRSSDDGGPSVDVPCQYKELP